MTESKQELERALRDFHRELVAIEDPDPRTLELIAKVREDLHIVESEDEDEDEGLLDRIEDAAAEFNAEHPVLAGNLRRVANLLSGLGI